MMYIDTPENDLELLSLLGWHGLIERPGHAKVDGRGQSLHPSKVGQWSGRQTKEKQPDHDTPLFPSSNASHAKRSGPSGVVGESVPPTENQDPYK